MGVTGISHPDNTALMRRDPRLIAWNSALPMSFPNFGFDDDHEPLEAAWEIGDDSEESPRGYGYAFNSGKGMKGLVTCFGTGVRSAFRGFVPQGLGRTLAAQKGTINPITDFRRAAMKPGLGRLFDSVVGPHLHGGLLTTPMRWAGSTNFFGTNWGEFPLLTGPTCSPWPMLSSMTPAVSEADSAERITCSKADFERLVDEAAAQKVYSYLYTFNDPRQQPFRPTMDRGSDDTAKYQSSETASRFQGLQDDDRRRRFGSSAQMETDDRRIIDVTDEEDDDTRAAHREDGVSKPTSMPGSFPGTDEATARTIPEHRQLTSGSATDEPTTPAHRQLMNKTPTAGSTVPPTRPREIASAEANTTQIVPFTGRRTLGATESRTDTGPQHMWLESAPLVVSAQA